VKAVKTDLSEVALMAINQVFVLIARTSLFVSAPVVVKAVKIDLSEVVLMAINQVFVRGMRTIRRGSKKATVISKSAMYRKLMTVVFINSMFRREGAI
jgi:hypothetical protein